VLDISTRSGAQEKPRNVMKVILPNCRQQFTPADLQFITRTLARSDNQERALMELLSDSETRDQILDEDLLFQALQDSPACSQISEHCYFYVLVRHVLRRVGLEDRRLADYVAELLAKFIREENASPLRDREGRPMRYVFEMLAADERTRFLIQAHVGNHTLFLTGLFPSHIRHQSERRGAPGIDYYEGMGKSSFKAASDHRLAPRYDLDRVLADLSEAFSEVRQALNTLSERVLWIGEN
jgi:hypothetical protein